MPHLTDIIREPTSMMRNGEAAEPSSLVSEIVKAVGEAVGDMIKNLVN